MAALDYDDVAQDYDRRYELYAYPGVQKRLETFVSGARALRVLEVGCGTGRWLTSLVAAGCEVAGIDPSERMLSIARQRVVTDLRLGVGEHLPWPDRSFDRVVYVNVLHHLADPPRAMTESIRVLRPGGRFLSIGLDPHERAGEWFIYEYFPDALTADLARFPSRGVRSAWLESAGFAGVAVDVVDRLRQSLSVDEAMRRGVLARTFTSQLAVISAERYSAGVRRIQELGAQSAEFALQVDIDLYGTEAKRPG